MRAAGTPSTALAVANQWLSGDLKGHARNESLTTEAPMTPEANNRARQATITQEIAEIVGGAAALQG